MFLLPHNDFLSRNYLFKQKTPSLFSTKNIAFWSLLRKSPNFWNVCLTLAFFHFGINFVPRVNTWMVVILGLNDFERLCTPTGMTWFSNMLRGAISIPKGSHSPRVLIDGLEPLLPDLSLPLAEFGVLIWLLADGWTSVSITALRARVLSIRTGVALARVHEGNCSHITLSKRAIVLSRWILSARTAHFYKRRDIEKISSNIYQKYFKEIKTPWDLEAISGENCCSWAGLFGWKLWLLGWRFWFIGLKFWNWPLKWDFFFLLLSVGLLKSIEFSCCCLILWLGNWFGGGGRKMTRLSLLRLPNAEKSLVLVRFEMSNESASVLIDWLLTVSLIICFTLSSIPARLASHLCWNVGFPLDLFNLTFS